MEVTSLRNCLNFIGPSCTTQTDPTFDHVYEPKLQESPVTPLNNPFSTPVLDMLIETPTIGQQQTCASILEKELFLDTMLKKAHYTTFKKEIITELQKTVKGIFNSELEQFKTKSETTSNFHASYQEQIQLLKKAFRTKDVMISKLTIENLNSNKNHSNCNTTLTNKSCNNDSEIQRSKNTHLAPPQWNILSTTTDTAITSDNGRSINVIPNISIEEQLREVRLQRDVQFKEYHRLLRKEKVKRKT